MPAFSYKERFVPFIKDFTKTGTIRAFRNYLIKPGQTSMHYFGMRTKHCVKLIPNQPLVKVYTIFIYANGDVYLANEIIPKPEANRLMMNKKLLRRVLGNKVWKLSGDQKDQLAWEDGFRDDKDMKNTAGSFDRMIRFWRMTHDLPFCGQYAKWR